MTDVNDGGESAPAGNQRPNRKSVTYTKRKEILFTVMHVVAAVCLVHLYVKVYSETTGQGCNSIGILNFGPKTGQSSETISVLGHCKYGHV